MKVKCVFNIPGDGDLDINKNFTVYGMSIWEDSLNYLLVDDDRPNWYLAKRFEIVNPLLPLIWYFNVRMYEDCDALESIWSYKEMALDPNHYVDLIEREPEALAIFARRKEEIDEYEELRGAK